LKIVNIVGARPNLPKIAPLMEAMLRCPDIEALLVHTGQHYDDALSNVFFRELGIPKPDVDLGVGSGTHAVQTAEVLRRIEPILVESKPDLVLVVGDVNSTLAVALCAAKLGIQIAHVEAGLRSFDRSMPEEINRVLTDALSTHLFVTEQDAIQNLRNEGRPASSIHFVGNVMIDSLMRFLPVAQKSNIGHDLGMKSGDQWRRFGILTLHRPSNVDSTSTLKNLLQAVGKVANELPIIFPAHPRTRERLNDSGITLHPQLVVVPPLGYLDFLCLLSNSSLVMTDSGGIQEETTALGVPCLTLRENTERPVTISHGTNTLVGTAPDKIHHAAQEILARRQSPAHAAPPLWDGKAAHRIVQILLHSGARNVPTVVASH
jgi:UDP-N-acetylglucosamine 2-epimerase (non-hydrolysing)